MAKDIRCILVFLSIVLLAPLLFGVAYLLWPVSYAAAIAVLFTGLIVDLVGGFELLDHISSAS
jgi:hypothetical protein